MRREKRPTPRHEPGMEEGRGEGGGKNEEFDVGMETERILKC